MRNSFLIIFSGLALLLMLEGCGQGQKKEVAEDTYSKGSIKFTADESFAPILDQELYVFKALHEEAKPQMIYKTENEALKLFLSDSVRVAILARNLKPQELRMLQQKNLPPEINCFAIDAVALIVNHSSTDTLTSVAEIKKMLNGQSGADKNIVFDNPNSSITRYLKDLSGNNEFKQKNIYALKSNVEVIKYVSEHPNALGFISYSWLLEPDKDYAAYVDKIKTVAVKDEANKDDPKNYYTPSQNTLAMRQYPLTRALYIINSTGKSGLGKGFASFLESERGQRIVLRSGLLPDSIPTREVSFGKSK
jgi:phosphate transport system substrate-binding protein